ncbi:MAG TPA: hypothetical protein DDZ43_02665 [Hyphomonadaceae bacterium]|nr:hypothetical protein [Hyphomonadaceae bacterium]
MLPKTRSNRKKSDFLSIRLLLALACGPLGACAAMPPPSSPMPAVGTAQAPSGLVTLCRTQPEVCQPEEMDRETLFASLQTEASSTGSIQLPEADVTPEESTPSLRGRSEVQTASLASADAQPAVELTETRAISPEPGLIEIKNFSPVTDLNLSASAASGFSVALEFEDMPAPLPSLRSNAMATAIYASLETLNLTAEQWSEMASEPEQAEPAAALSTAIERILSPAERSIIQMDSDIFATVEHINHRINAAIIPRTDQQTYGQNELWTLPLTFQRGRAGDCEDYALEKREALIRAGIPATALYFAVGHSPATGRHAVLVIATDQGDYVLDNMTTEIRPWFATDYTWISRQSAGDPLVWANVS